MANIGLVSMKIYIVNGYYEFYPDGPMDIMLARERGLDLVPHNGFYTFPALVNAPTYSLVDKDCATVQYSGSQSDVMGANKWVYSLTLREIVPMSSIMLSSGLNFDGMRITSKGIPQAGAKVGTQGRLRSCVISWKPEGDACLIQGVELWTL